jgi:hypothetical protein
MWIFAGGLVEAVATLQQSDAISIRDEFPPSLGKGRSTGFNHRLKGGSVMRPVKTIAILAFAAAIASSIFAVSWVGLALLGF